MASVNAKYQDWLSLASPELQKLKKNALNSQTKQLEDGHTEDQDHSADSSPHHSVFLPTPRTHTSAQTSPPLLPDQYIPPAASTATQTSLVDVVPFAVHKPNDTTPEHSSPLKCSRANQTPDLSLGSAVRSIREQEADGLARHALVSRCIKAVSPRVTI
eukprot:1179205-Prorocentrum_minimum.AAC.5